jgi:hypothetical protein
MLPVRSDHVMTNDEAWPALFHIEATAIIHENLGIVLTYAFSKPALDEYRGWLRENQWFVADRVLVELPRQRATRAIVELAVMFRALDDINEITKHDYVAGHPYVVDHPTGYVYGRLVDDREPEPLPTRRTKKSSVPRASSGNKALSLRDVSNKIIHAKRIEWSFDSPREPLIICHAAETDTRSNWSRAEVFVKPFAAVCMALASPPGMARGSVRGAFQVR